MTVGVCGVIPAALGGSFSFGVPVVYGVRGLRIGGTSIFNSGRAFSGALAGGKGGGISETGVGGR